MILHSSHLTTLRAVHSLIKIIVYNPEGSHGGIGDTHIDILLWIHTVSYSDPCSQLRTKKSTLD